MDDDDKGFQFGMVVMVLIFTCKHFSSFVVHALKVDSSVRPRETTSVLETIPKIIVV